MYKTQPGRAITRRPDRPQIEAVSLTDSWIKYLYLQGRIGKNTERTYRAGIKVLFRFLSDHKIENPDLNSMQLFKNWLEEKESESPNTRGGKLSLSIKNLYIIVAKSFFKFLHDTGRVINDCWQVKTIKSKTPKRLKVPARLDVTFQEYEQILAMTPGHSLRALRDRAIIKAMGEAGLRGIEVHRLQHEDFKFIDGIYYFRVMGKGRSETELQPTTPDGAQAFIEYQKALKEKFDYKPTDPAFISLANNSKSERISTASPRRMVEKLLDSLNISPDRRVLLSVHSLRHYYITSLFKGGATRDEVQSAARHSNFETTDIYIHERKQQETARRCVEILEKFKETERQKQIIPVGYYETERTEANSPVAIA